MDDLIRIQTEESPEIQFLTSGNLLIKGISVLENVNAFYKEVFEWIEQLEKTPPPAINLVFEIEYLNTSSNKICIELARKVNNFKNLGTKLNFVWRYQEGDEDTYELGKDIEYWTGTEFKFEVYG